MLKYETNHRTQSKQKLFILRFQTFQKIESPALTIYGPKNRQLKIVPSSITGEWMETGFSLHGNAADSRHD